MGHYPLGGGRPFPAADGVGLPPVIRALCQPRFYPHRPGEVQLLQTHISYVFLAGPLVYKVKKPVDFGFLNYSTLRRRAFWCRREVELNRRLAPDLYRGVAKIYRRRGEYSLQPPGKVVEYAVVMKRLPEERIFASLMSRGRATLAQARRIARRVAAFHSSVPKAATRNSRLSVLRRNIEENFRQTEPYIGRTVKAGDYLEVRDYSCSFLEKRGALLGRRVREGRFRDGHGDLHAEHICLTNGIEIFDCLEFNPRLRQCDVAAEIAFLYMDLLYHRHPHLARAFAEEYIRVTGDWEIRLLLPFYACYRAVVREKVESLRLIDPHVSASRKREARRRAAAYFFLARDLARKDGRPRLFTIGGLPGTGKSSLASLWAERLGALYLNSDALRKEMAGGGPSAPGKNLFRGGIYTPEWTKRTYGEMARRAEESLRAGRSVVLDATFARRSHRRTAAAAARRAGARLISVECRCSEKTVRERLRRRARRGASLSDADWDIYLAIKKEYAAPRRETVRVDTDRDREKAFEKIAAATCPL
jgi:aminoglycoside phosphotransferase family enzyme/predicted kinase